MILPEQNKKLPLEKRRDLIKQVASADAGQALREEFIDIMNDVGNICKVPDQCWSNNEVLASEARGRDIARKILDGNIQYVNSTRRRKERSQNTQIITWEGDNPLKHKGRN